MSGKVVLKGDGAALSEVTLGGSQEPTNPWAVRQHEIFHLGIAVQGDHGRHGFASSRDQHWSMPAQHPTKIQTYLTDGHRLHTILLVFHNCFTLSVSDSSRFVNVFLT